MNSSSKNKHFIIEEVKQRYQN